MVGSLCGLGSLGCYTFSMNCKVSGEVSINYFNAFRICIKGIFERLLCRPQALLYSIVADWTC
jgi:hypothetical protein